MPAQTNPQNDRSPRPWGQPSAADRYVRTWGRLSAADRIKTLGHARDDLSASDLARLVEATDAARRVPTRQPRSSGQTAAATATEGRTPMRTLLSGAALAAALVLSLTSCTGADPTSKAEDSASTAPTAGEATSTASTDPTGEEQTLCQDPKALTPFTGPAALRFGADQVMDAYCEMADFFYWHAVTDLTPPQKSVDPADLAWVDDWMIDPGLADWRKDVRKELKDLGDGDGDINRITYFNLRGLVWGGRTFPDAGSGLPGQTGGGISGATASPAVFDGKAVLDMWFTQATNVSMQKGGKGIAVPVVRKVALRLIPTGGGIKAPHSWLIAGWSVSYESSDPKPLSQFSKHPKVVGAAM